MSEENTTSSEEATTEETIETQEEATGEEVTEDLEHEFTIDDLLGLTEEDYPEFQEDVNHKGMKPLHEWMKHTPEEVRKHIANMRSSYTRKTQELAEERKQLEALREELMQTKEHTMNNPVLEEVSKHITDEEHDIYSEEGQRAEIKRQAALMLQEMMKPAQEKIQAERRAMELNNFKTQNPELTQEEYRVPIAKMLMERPELKLEDAFYIVKAKIASELASKEKSQIQAQRSNRRQAYSKTSTGKNTARPQPPKSRDAWTLFQWHKDNPGYKR
jgi:hypothetical protein